MTDFRQQKYVGPRIFVDESQSYRGFNCNGSNPRYNALSVDGIGLNDGFGLNSNGYPTSRMPFSYDAIEQVSVEFAPYDVMYGGFAAAKPPYITSYGANSTETCSIASYENGILEVG